MSAGHGLGGALGVALAADEPTPTLLWPWLVRQQRGRGAVAASYDVLRRMLEEVRGPGAVAAFLAAGLLRPEDMAASIAARPIRPEPGSLPGRARAFLRAPALGARALAAAGRAAVVESWWRQFPATPEPRRFAAWQRGAEALLP
jgi:hypothetical protein